MLFKPVPTPCVGICSTTYGDVVCRGCRRYLHEVINWNRFSEAEKRLVWQRLDSLLEQVLPASFHIDEPARLRERLQHYRIPFREDASAWAWLHALLKASAKQLQSQPDVLAEFGVSRIDRSTLSLAQLREKLNADLHRLAEAYYEKDYLRFNPPGAQAPPAP